MKEGVNGEWKSPNWQSTDEHCPQFCCLLELYPLDHITEVIIWCSWMIIWHKSFFGILLWMFSLIDNSHTLLLVVNSPEHLSLPLHFIILDVLFSEKVMSAMLLWVCMCVGMYAHMCMHCVWASRLCDGVLGSKLEMEDSYIWFPGQATWDFFLI